MHWPEEDGEAENYAWESNPWDRDAFETQEAHHELVCRSKFGTVTPTHLESSQPPVLTQSFMLPVEGVSGDAAFAGTAYY